MTSHVRWTVRPTLREPVLVAAFEGWNDAGEAATGAVSTLSDAWRANQFADIDPEEFFDFTANRPMVRLVAGTTRHIDWPSNTFSAASVPGTEVDVVLLSGTEPGLRWRTFCEEILGVAAELGVRRVVTLGALLAEVPHTRPVRVVGTSEDEELTARLGLRRSIYEGPTGVTGVLQDACRKQGLSTASLWAAVPTYVSGPASPAATLALVERLTALLEVPFDTTALHGEAEAYRRRIDDVVEEDEDLTAYLRRLEEDHDDDVAEPADPATFIAEVERFLRDQ